MHTIVFKVYIVYLVLFVSLQRRETISW